MKYLSLVIFIFITISSQQYSFAYNNIDHFSDTITQKEIEKHENINKKYLNFNIFSFYTFAGFKYDLQQLISLWGINHLKAHDIAVIAYLDISKVGTSFITKNHFDELSKTKYLILSHRNKNIKKYIRLQSKILNTEVVKSKTFTLENEKGMFSTNITTEYTGSSDSTIGNLSVIEAMKAGICEKEIDSYLKKLADKKVRELYLDEDATNTTDSVFNKIDYDKEQIIPITAYRKEISIIMNVRYHNYLGEVIKEGKITIGSGIVTVISCQSVQNAEVE